VRDQGPRIGRKMKKTKCKKQNCGGPSGRFLFVASKISVFSPFIIQNVQKLVIYDAK
jgi:hypothetical protein